jgi:RHS repeat-associated protein
MLALRNLLILAVLVVFPSIAQARWYDPSTGRWLQRDPLGTMNAQVAAKESPEEGYHDGMSRYQYVKSRPIVAVDPDGLELRFASRDDEKFFVGLANKLCPEGKFKVEDPWGKDNRRIVSGDSKFCNDYEEGRGWSCSKNTVTMTRKAASSSRPTICMCLCDAINSSRIIKLFHSTTPAGQSHSPGGYVTTGTYDEVYVGTGRPGGYRGRYANPSDRPSSMSPGQVMATPEIIFAHELCGHALPKQPHPPVGHPDRYTERDPVIIIENTIRRELGPEYGHREY